MCCPDIHRVFISGVTTSSQETNSPGAPEHGFSWVIFWTILGALIPGAGLIVAGRRWFGAVVLAGTAALVTGLLIVTRVGSPIERIESLAVDQKKLLILAIVTGVIAAVWLVVIVVTTTQLRRWASLTLIQNGFNWLVVVVLVVAVGVPAYEVSDYTLLTRSVVKSPTIFTTDVDNPDPGPDPKEADPWAGKSRENVLLIGSDAGSDRVGIRPDTMILASINTKTGNTVLLSLPRNLERAPFPASTPGHKAWPNGYNCGDECLLNAIWTWASGVGSPYYGKYKNPGLRATEDAIQGVTGLKVDTYVMLNLDGFKDFVDAIGGVTVDIHERLPIGGQGSSPYEPYYHQAPGGYLEIGNNQHLNGYKALWFARSRWASDDYHRMQRQRCVIGDVVHQADPVTLALAFPKIAKTLKKNLQTGIPAADLNAWVQLSERIKGASVTSLPFTSDVINVVHPDIAKIHKLVKKALKAPATKTAASASPSPTPTSSPTSSSTKHSKAAAKKHKKKAATDVTKAQDVTKVC